MSHAETAAVDLSDRPFAESLGYQEWGDQAGHIVSVLLEHIDEHSLLVDPSSSRSDSDSHDVLALQMIDICRAACEEGHASRSKDVLSLKSQFFTNLARPYAMDGASSHRAQRVPQPGSLELIGWFEAAFASYIWGRHGSALYSYQDVPPIINMGDKYTILPDALNARVSRVTSKIVDLSISYEPYKPSLRERLFARLFERASDELWVKGREPDLMLHQKIKNALVDELLLNLDIIQNTNKGHMPQAGE